MPDLSKFVRAEEAQRRTGLSERSLDRRLAAREIPVYRDPLDRRHRLIAVSDLDSLLNVTPYERGRQVIEQVAS